MMYPENEVKKPINRSAVARIIIWAVVLAILLGVFVCAIVLEGSGMMFGINLGGYIYEDPDSYQVGNGEISTVITALDVDWIDGSVEILPVEGDKVTIKEVYQGENDNDRLRWKLKDGKLTVKYCKSGRSMLFKNTKGKALTIEVPKTMLEAMETVDVELVSAKLELRGLKAEELDISAVSGKVIFEGSLKELDVKTVSGNLDLTGSVDEADIEGVSATIKATLLNHDAVLDIETVSGDVEVYLPKAQTTGFEATMDAVSGSISVDGFDDLTKTKDYCRYGDGSLKIHVDAVSGDLNIYNKD